MPRDQETSIGHDPTTSDDPLFREPADQDGDQSLRGHGDPLRDPLDADDDETSTPGATPIGDTLAAGLHADGDQNPSDSPGEWVAGTKGPGPAQDRDGAVVPDQPGQPAVESTDPVAGDPLASDTSAGARTGTRATMDPDAPDAPDAPDDVRFAPASHHTCTK